MEQAIDQATVSVAPLNQAVGDITRRVSLLEMERGDIVKHTEGILSASIFFVSYLQQFNHSYVRTVSCEGSRGRNFSPTEKPA